MIKNAYPVGYRKVSLAISKALIRKVYFVAQK